MEMKNETTHRNSFSSTIDAAPYILGVLPLLVFSLYSVKIRIQSKYFESILTASGLTPDQARLYDFAFLYRNDFLLIGVLAPIAILISYRLMQRNISSLLWSAITSLALILLYANLQTWGQVGRFMTFSALIDAITFGISKPEMIRDYISIGGLLKLITLTGSSLVVFLFAHHMKPYRHLHRCAALAGLACIPTSLAIALVGTQSSIDRNQITNSFLMNCFYALTSTSKTNTTHNASSISEINSSFLTLHHLTATPSPNINAGVERQSNLLLFVLETGSIDFLDVRKKLPDHPVWNKLSHSLFIGANHYSVFPASAESNLAILTGMYPPRAYYDTCLVDLKRGEAIPSVITSMAQRGVTTAAYLPYPSQVPMDKVTFEHTGFKKVYYGQHNKRPDQKDADILSLEEMLKDIGDWSRHGEQFAVGFFPQRGHGPWPAHLGENIIDRGKAVAMQQLDWLLEIVSLLESSRTLEKTVIIITGDHGVRTSQEDESVRVGMIDRYSLHVPLFIYAPNARYPTGPIDSPTSHVDLAAEIVHLFDLKKTSLQQGLPLLSSDIEKRRQFFMASWYYGADGFRSPEGSAMYSNVLDIAYARNDGELSFNTINIVRNKNIKDNIRDTLDQVLDLQFSWIQRFACDSSVQMDNNKAF